jgi:hemerythrin
MKKVSMNLNDFIKEHKHLINVLNNGTKAERMKEASKQKKELMERLKR